jgi:uncharacterized GH25 family protein
LSRTIWEIRDKIILVKAPANVITGKITNTNGTPLANATVQIEMIQLQLGSNTLNVEDLDNEWKAGFSAVTDSKGNYILGHLPSFWSQAALDVQVEGYKAGMQSISKTGQNTLCDITITE